MSQAEDSTANESNGHYENAFLSPSKVARRLQIGFFVILGIGSACIALFPKMWLLPVGTMVLYLAFGLLVVKRPKERDVFADSFYYMGFLFTFVSLLFLVGPFGAGADPLTSKDVIPKLGIALTTTVFGMAMRLIITHFSQITENPDEELRQSTAAITSKLHDELSQALESVHRQRMNLVRQIADQEKQVGKSYKEMSGTLRKELQNNLSVLDDFRTKAISDIHAQNELTTEKLEETLLSLTSSIGDQITDTVKRIGDASDGLSRKINELKIPADYLQNTMTSAIGPVVDQFNQLGDSAKKVTETAEQLTNQTTQIAQGLGSALDSITEITRQLSHYSDIGEAASTAKSSLIDVAKAVTDLNAAVARLQEEAENVVDRELETLFGGVSQVEKNLNKVNSLLRRVKARTADLSHKAEVLLSEALELFRKEIQKK